MKLRKSVIKNLKKRGFSNEEIASVLGEKVAPVTVTIKKKHIPVMERKLTEDGFFCIRRTKNSPRKYEFVGKDRVTIKARRYPFQDPAVVKKAHANRWKK